MKRFRSLEEFATEDLIVRVLTKERAKVDANERKGARRSPLADALCAMMPPKSVWTRPGRDLRPKKSGRSTDRWTYPRKIADARIYLTIAKARRLNPDVDWLTALDTYIGKIRAFIVYPESFTFQPPDVYKVFKKKDKAGNFIYRPICVYSDLDTKVMMAVIYRYLLEVLDGCFHRNMLFMRASRKVTEPDGANAGRKTASYTDCVRLADQYRRRHDGENIWVGECDIQNFYDILNHEAVMECFMQLLSMRARQQGVPVSSYALALSFIEKYLASYDFYHRVWLRNADEAEWRSEVRRLRRKGVGNPVCKFKWVPDEEFLRSGYYDGESLRRAKEEGLLGIPQGGSLSGLIINVVMQCIDDDIVRGRDGDRFFVRYCDDILLMHTDRDRCREYLATYHANLRRYGLIPHHPKDVSSAKNGARTLQSFWKDSKSKNVYLWGKGCGDASEWIGFVGYELSRSGEIRIRKDKTDDLHRKIARRYHQVVNADSRRSPEERLARFNTLAPKIRDYEMVTFGRRSSLDQARHLDKYLIFKFRSAARKLGIRDPEGLATYGDEVRKG